PGKYTSGKQINISLIDPLLLHMGTQIRGSRIETAGGRVAIVVAKGQTLQEARQEAYRKVESITSNELFYRKDIALF
ncbi:MAG: phosphoribosylglycinamide synthetase C domain-containing protein, partial [Candidatus Izemoplasmatales bacterium]